MIRPPKASIIIPVGQDAPGLAVTLSSLQALHERAEDFEVIVCNDGGHRDVSAVAGRFRCIEVLLPVNRGSYASRNAGIAAAQGEILAFLDADQRVDRAWLSEGIRSLEHADYVGGRVVLETSGAEDIWHEYDREYAFPVEDYLRRKRFAPTANLFVRKQVVDAVGPFNAMLRSGGDWEFGMRVARGGFRQAFQPEAMTYHPSRSRKEQLRKLRRTASGIIDVRVHVLGESPVALASGALLRLASVPLQFASQALKWMFLPGHRAQPGFSFALIRKVHALVFEFWSFRRAVGCFRRPVPVRLFTDRVQ
jgi:glycosyltransferase involved in cell wall biosynthesis